MLHMPPKTSANPHVTAALAQIEKAMREPPMGASAGWPRTFEDLAERAGSSRGTWQKWRSGRREPGFMELHRYAQAVGCGVGVVCDSRPSTETTEGNMDADLEQLVAVAATLDPRRRRNLLLTAIAMQDMMDPAGPGANSDTATRRS